MFIIADKRIPSKAKDRLANYGELIEFETKGITEEAISGHPDIFFFKTGDHIITPPNLPDNYKELFSKKGIPTITGKKFVTGEYPGCAAYNAVISDDYLVHRLDITDPEIIEISTGHVKSLSKINVSQGFTRCNLMPLKGNRFITSDEGIKKSLESKSLEVLYIDPAKIILPGHKHGFFGGCCGLYKNNVYILGSLSYIPEGKRIFDYLKSLAYEIIELYKGPLFDGGSILFIDK